jgi:hypothetical protein
MKKVLIMALCFLLLIATDAVAQYKYRGSGQGVTTASDCSTYIAIGQLCQDTDDGKLYKGTGSGVTEIAAGSSGDVTAVTKDITWGDGTGPSVFTFSVTGTDPTLTATASKIAIGGALDVAGTLSLGSNNITSTGSLGATGAGKLTKGWFTDLEITNLPSINGTSIHTSPTFTTSILPQASTATIGSSSAEWGGLYLGDSKIIYGQADQSNTLTSSSTGWTAALNLSAAAFVPTSAANAEGEIGFNAASHAYSLYANAEDLSITATADKWTIASGTSATVTITPALTVTGQLTMTANPRIYDGDSHYLTIDASNLTGNATVALGGDTNTLSVANGTASLTLTADQAVKFGTLTATKYCTWETATGITCTAEGGEAGSGDVTDIGDCSSGACLDGSSDGGTYISFYDAQGATKLQVGDNSGAVTLTLPTTTGTLMLTDAEITALAGLTSAANAIPYFTGSGTAGVISSSANMVSLLGSTDYDTARTNLGLAIGTNVQAYDAELAALAGLTSAQGSLPYFTGSGTATTLAKGTDYQMLQMNSGATAPEWTSTLSVTGIDLTAGTFNIPNGTTALNTGAGRIYFNTTSKAFSIGDGSSSYYAPTSLAPLSFTTGGTTARTVTLPNADATLLYSGGALGTPSGGTLTNCTGLPIAGTTGWGTGVATAAAINVGTAGALTTTLATGTQALGTAEIAASACASVATTAATGVATTDVIDWGFNGDPTSTTGYTAGAMLTIIAYPTANNVNFKVCNNTTSAITPGAVTLNWRVRR